MEVPVPRSTGQGLLLQSSCIPTIHGGQMCESGHRSNHKSPTVQYLANSSICAFESPIGDRDGRYHHLFDPRTGTSSGRYRAITVVAPNATTADALSTAFASMDVPDVKMVLTQYPSATARLTARSGEVTTLSL